MPAKRNHFKRALKAGLPQMGGWLSMADPYMAEISGTAGFDWLLIDGEHSPNDLRSIMAQLQVLEASDSNAIVRVPVGDTALIKQMLDIGAQSILVPMIESAEHAREMARAMRYPPNGIRGVGAGGARVSKFGDIKDYLQTADDEVCLLLQVENRAGLAALDDILAVEGVDGVFIGPSDLAADLGHIGDAMHPEVVDTITDAIKRIVATGKAAGILAQNLEFAKTCLSLGATFVATAIDVSVFASAIRKAADDAKGLSA